MAPPELPLVVGAFFDPMDGVFKEPDPALSLGNLLPGQLVQGVLFELLVADVQLPILLHQGLFQGSQKFRILT